MILRLSTVFALAALLGATACASPGAPKSAASGDANTATSEARAAVAAFSRICGRLESGEIARRAASFGFMSLRRELLPPEATASLRPGTLVFIRPGEGTPMLFWHETRQCQLVMAGLATGEVEAEFTRMLASLAASSNLNVESASPAQLAALRGSEPLQARQAAIVTPRALVADGQRAFVLHIQADGPRGPVVSLTTAAVGDAPTPDGTVVRQLPKDPVRL
jgi:hypothetical protein